MSGLSNYCIKYVARVDVERAALDHCQLLSLSCVMQVVLLLLAIFLEIA